MQAIYTDSKIYWPDFEGPGSLFLAGPTPRHESVLSWRPEALQILKDMGFKGSVFIPEGEHVKFPLTFLDQVEWEHERLLACARIVFWVPRNLDTMPAFTTNVEFGRFVNSRRAYYGRPDGAPNTRYLDWLFHKFNPEKKIHNSLKDLLQDAGTWEFLKEQTNES